MLPRRNRLTRSAQFKSLREQGRAWRDPLAVLLVDANALPDSRFGFVVSRRVGSAVVRNRVRRKLRETLRRHLADIKSGRDCLLIARPGIVEVSATDLEAALLQLFERAALLREPPQDLSPSPGC